MVCVQLVLMRHAFQKSEFDFQGGFALGQSHTVAHAKDMSVNGDGGFVERTIEHHIRGFSTHAWQAFEFLASAGNLRLELVDQYV